MTTTTHTIDVSVLIVGYKSRDLLEDCLSGLYAHTDGVAMEVLYVDCSDDGSCELLREKFPQTRVIDNSENLGFGRGNNFLARHAEGRYLLLLNPDTLIEDNAIGKLVAFADSTADAGAWGGMTILPDGRVDPGSQQKRPGIRHSLYRLLGLNRLNRGGLTADATAPADVEVLCGAFMMVRRDVWEQLGGFDESFFLYCEEVDLCYRLNLAGYRIWMTPDSKIVHLVGSGDSKSGARMVALTKGSVHFDRKHFGPIHNGADLVLRWLYSATRYAGGVLAAPVLGAERAAKLRDRNRPIVFSPNQWIHGWADMEPAPPASDTPGTPNTLSNCTTS